MIIVTGGAGFIGSNLIKALNQRGENKILVVDDLKDGQKFKNIVDCTILDYMDKQDFLHRVTSIEDGFDYIKAIFHQGACSTTTEWDGHYMLKNNYDYSKSVLNYCLHHNIQFIYASSAAVYGAGTTFREEPAHEKPLNIYGYSKYLFDQHVRSLLPKIQSQVAGCRYFNVYGPREFHKGSMASVAFHLNSQLQETGKVRLFEGSDGYPNGEQRRDFIYVDDAVAVNLWLYDHPQVSGIFNVGTGRSQSFNDIARAVINGYGQGEIEYIPFPKTLIGRYQNFTQADISKLREKGCDVFFRTVGEGIRDYLNWLKENA